MHTTITKIGTYELPRVNGSLNVPQKVLIRGSLLFIATSASGLLICDISNPRRPTLVGQFMTAEAVVDIAVVDPLVYVAERTTGVKILELRAVNNLHLLGEYRIDDGAVVKIQVEQLLLYMRVRSKGFQIIDVSVPSAPYLLGQYNGRLFRFHVVENYAYWTGDGGINDQVALFGILDVTNPAAPELISLIRSDSQTVFGSPYYADGFVYIVNNGKYGSGGVLGFDVRNPARPEYIGGYGHTVNPVVAVSLQVFGQLVFANINEAVEDVTRLLAINASLPPPFPLRDDYDIYSTAGVIGDFFVLGNLICCAIETRVDILKIDRPYNHFLPVVSY